MNVASQLAAVVEAGRADTAERRHHAEAATRVETLPNRLAFAVGRGLLLADAQHFAALDPATVLRLCDQEDRHYAAAEDILHAHWERGTALHVSHCGWDGEVWPCSVLDIEAARWGIS